MTALPKNQCLANAGQSSQAGDASAQADHRSGHVPEQSATQDRAAERVGYRSPPREHQFKKGKSGNPRGRPRKSLNRHTVIIRTLHDAALAEAQRVINVGRGNSLELMTVLEATLRGISERAINGDPACGRLILQLVSSAQKEKDEQRLAVLNVADEYKLYWNAVFAQCDREGRPRPETLPHPDDVVIDPRTGGFGIVGPMTQEEKVITDRIVGQREQLIALLERPNHLAVARPHVRHKIRARQVQEIEELNALLPPRLRRSYDGSID